MDIAYLARAENELVASLLEDELRFVLREDVRGAIVLLRQLLLPLHHFAGKANDHVVLIGFFVNRDGTECGALDLHGLTLVPNPARGSDSASADEPRSDANLCGSGGDKIQTVITSAVLLCCVEPTYG